MKHAILYAGLALVAYALYTRQQGAVAAAPTGTFNGGVAGTSGGGNSANDATVAQAQPAGGIDQPLAQAPIGTSVPAATDSIPVTKPSPDALMRAQDRSTILYHEWA